MFSEEFLIKRSSYMFASNNVLNFEALIRANVYSFRERLPNSNNSIINALYNNQTCRFKIWKTWQTIMYI